MELTNKICHATNFCFSNWLIPANYTQEFFYEIGSRDRVRGSKLSMIWLINFVSLDINCSALDHSAMEHTSFFFFFFFWLFGRSSLKQRPIFLSFPSVPFPGIRESSFDSEKKLFRRKKTSKKNSRHFSCEIFQQN